MKRTENLKRTLIESDGNPYLFEDEESSESLKRRRLKEKNPSENKGVACKTEGEEKSGSRQDSPLRGHEKNNVEHEERNPIIINKDENAKRNPKHDGENSKNSECPKENTPTRKNVEEKKENKRSNASASQPRESKFWETNPVSSEVHKRSCEDFQQAFDELYKNNASESELEMRYPYRRGKDLTEEEYNDLPNGEIIPVLGRKNKDNSNAPGKETQTRRKRQGRAYRIKNIYNKEL